MILSVLASRRGAAISTSAPEPPSKDDAIEAASGGGAEGAVVGAMAGVSSASPTAVFGAEVAAT